MQSKFGLFLQGSNAASLWRTQKDLRMWILKKKPCGQRKTCKPVGEMVGEALLDAQKAMLCCDHPSREVGHAREGHEKPESRQ